MKLSLNCYDYLVIFIISLLVFGNYGGALQPIRLISILSIPYVFIQLHKMIMPFHFKQILFFFMFWYVYSLCSCFWTSNISEAVKQLIYYISHFNLFIFIFILASKALNPFKAILIGWCLFFILTIPIALNEIINDKHLLLSLFEDGQVVNYGGVIVNKKFASVTFGNYNSYVTVLGMALPFLLTSIFVFRRKATQVMLFNLITCLTFILFTNASRGGMLVWGISLLIFSYYYIYRFNISKVYFFLLISAFCFFMIFSSDILFNQIGYRLESGESLFEDNARQELYIVVLDLFMQTYGFGLGIGSLITSLKAIRAVGVVIPHNMWLEILVQYGLLIFIGFVFFVYKTTRRLIESHMFEKKQLGYVVLFSLFPLSLIDSGYLLNPSFWVFWSSLYVISSLNRL